MKFLRFSDKIMMHTVLLVCLCFLLTGSMAYAQQPISVQVKSESITAAPLSSAVNYIQMKVKGPGGNIVFNKSCEGTPIAWMPTAELENGRYSYEVRAADVVKKTSRSETAPKEKTSRPWVYSGSVIVKNGVIIISDEKEAGFFNNIKKIGSLVYTEIMDFLCPSAYADQVIEDDLIVTGSECIGFDCVSGESFGYNALKLKENNLQILFEDTSNTSGFSTNDWKIQVNGTESGAPSYFTIWDLDAGKRVFTLEAGAPSNALYVDDYGRVGLGTSVPYAELHIVDGASPTVRLDQDGSNGWTPQVWEIAGNESDFFIRDVTNGSKRPFRIEPNTPENTLTLKSTGNVGIGTWDPAASLEVETTAEDSELMLQRTDGATLYMAGKENSVVLGSKSNHGLSFIANDSQVATLDTGGNMYLTGNLELGSSRELKQDIMPVNLAEAVEALNGLNPVKFRYKAHPSDEIMGFIAEDVPDLVATESRKTTSPMDVVAILTKVVQEQERTISELKYKLDALETEVRSKDTVLILAE